MQDGRYLLCLRSVFYVRLLHISSYHTQILLVIYDLIILVYTYPAKSTFLFNHTYVKVIGGLGKVLIQYMEAGAPKENKVLHLNHSKQECLWCILSKNTRTDFSALLPSHIYISHQSHIQRNDRRVR